MTRRQTPQGSHRHFAPLEREAVGGDLRMSAVTASQYGAFVHLSWWEVAGAQSYRVERAQQGGTFALVGTSVGGVYVDASVQAGTVYQYRVRARRQGDTGPASAVVAITTGS